MIIARIGALQMMTFLVLVSAADAQNLFVVSGADTGRVTTVIDTLDTSGTGPPVVDIRTVIDTLAIEVSVGDTIAIGFYAEGWPEVSEYFALLEHNATILAADDTRTLDFPFRVIDYVAGPFWDLSTLPASAAGAILTDGIMQVTQSDSRGQDGGQLGLLRLVVINPTETEDRSRTIVVAAYHYRLLDVTQDFVPSLIEVNIPIRIRVQPLPEPVTADKNGNGVVDFEDFILFAGHFGTWSGGDDYDDAFDFDQSGHVGFSDFLLLAADFGKEPRVYWLRPIS